MSQRLFRVYFSVAPHVPAHNYRHIWAESLDKAKEEAASLIEKHRSNLEPLDFFLGAIQEEGIRLFSEHLQELSGR